MKCPECDTEVAADVPECPACGLIFERFKEAHGEIEEPPKAEKKRAAVSPITIVFALVGLVLGFFLSRWVPSGPTTPPSVHLPTAFPTHTPTGSPVATVNPSTTPLAGTPIPIPAVSEVPTATPVAAGAEKPKAEAPAAVPQPAGSPKAVQAPQEAAASAPNPTPSPAEFDSPSAAH